MKFKTDLFPRMLASIAITAFSIFCTSSDSLGQQIAVSAPLNSVSDSFYENVGVNFGFSFPGGRGPGSRIVGYGPGGFITPNINFTQGGFRSAIPPFGGYDPNADARFGFARIGPNGGGFSLGMSMGKGSSRSNVSTTPSIVVQNGYGGSIFNGAFVPFVTGVTPVIGNGANIVQPRDNAVTRALNSGQLDLTKPMYEEEVDYRPRSYSNPGSTAQSGDNSVEAIKAARAAAIAKQQQLLNDWIEKAEMYREEGNFKEAKKSYRMAIRNCDDDRQKKKLRRQLSELSGR